MSVGVSVGVSACMVNTPPKEQKRLYKSGFFVKIYPFNSFFRVKTYRYIFPLCKKFQFVGKEKPYPEYDKGMEQIERERDRRKIKANIICLLDKLVA